jgi:alpha-tubulin suppressor-like RCC1 family protein
MENMKNKLAHKVLTISSLVLMTSFLPRILSTLAQADYTYPAPSITSISPASGAINEYKEITLSGSGFDYEAVFSKVAVGSGHACGLGKVDQQIYCWGLNNHGQLGNGTIINSLALTPVKADGVMAGHAIVDIFAENTTTFALDDQGNLYGWGRNSVGQIGDGTIAGRTQPVLVQTGGVVFTQFSFGAGHAFGLTASGELYGWGQNDFGQLGNGQTSNVLKPTLIALNQDEEIEFVRAGHTQSLLKTASGQLYTAGSGSAGALGVQDLSAANPDLTPCGANYASWCAYNWTAVYQDGVLSGQSIVDVAMGSDGIMTLAETGDLFAWGSNNVGQLGIGYGGGTHNTAKAVTAFPGGVKAQKLVSTNFASSYGAVGTDGQLYMWGYNTSGQLGTGDTVNRSAPAQLDLVLPAPSQVVSGGTSTYYLDATGRLYAWGANDYGQLGDNNLSSSYYPVSVQITGTDLSGKIITQIASGSLHSCVLADDPATQTTGGVYCWGDNYYGQLGVGRSGNGAESSTAVKISQIYFGDQPVKFLALGQFHSVAVTADNKIYAWGRNNSWQLGQASSVSIQAIPAEIASYGAIPAEAEIIGLSSVSVASHTCVIAAFTEGTYKQEVYCWGANGSGQLGNGSTVGQQAPSIVATGGSSAIDAGTLITKVAAGDGQTCAADNNQQIYCWGLNSYGQLGNNLLIESHLPVLVDFSNLTNLSALTLKILSSGGSFNFAVFSNSVTGSDEAWFWGLASNNRSGAILPSTGEYTCGASNVACAKKPYQVVLDASIVQVIDVEIVGGYGFLIDQIGQVWGWGPNANGRNGTGGDQSVPAKVTTANTAMNGKAISQVSAGANHAIALSDLASGGSNELFAWGDDVIGQLGDGSLLTGLRPGAGHASFIFPFEVYLRDAQGGSTSAIVQSTTANNLRFLAPPARLDYTNLVDIQLLGSGAAATEIAPLVIEDGYKYVAPPSVTGVSPGTGLTAGGETVVITGNSFDHPQVYFGSSLATVISGGGIGGDGSPTALTVTTPAKSGAGGFTNITVMNADGTSGNLPNGFYYETPPALALNPPAGPGYETQLNLGQTVVFSGFLQDPDPSQPLTLTVNFYDDLGVLAYSQAYSQGMSPQTKNWTISFSFEDLINYGDTFPKVDFSLSDDYQTTIVATPPDLPLMLLPIQDLFAPLVQAMKVRFAGQLYYPLSRLTDPADPQGPSGDGYSYLATIDETHQVWQKELLNQPPNATTSATATQLYPFLVKGFDANPKMGEIRLK